MSGRPEKTCKCGHTKTHELVEQEPEYTLWGWLVLSMTGITPKPDHIVYRCTMCHQKIATTRDPRVLAARTRKA